MKAAQDVLICDGTGRHEAVSCADHLSKQGHKVTLATIDDRAGTEMGYPDRAVYRKRLYEQGVETLPDLRISGLARDGNRLIATFTNELSRQIRKIEADQVVVEVGTDAFADVFFELQSQSKNQGMTDVDALANYAAQPALAGEGFMLHRIGDALTSRSIHAAILEAYRIAVRI